MLQKIVFRKSINGEQKFCYISLKYYFYCVLNYKKMCIHFTMSHSFI